MNGCSDCGERIFLEDFGISELPSAANDYSRATSPYMSSNSFTFGRSIANSTVDNETMIDNNHYAVVAPPYIHSGSNPVNNGWYFWTKPYNTTGSGNVDGKPYITGNTTGDENDAVMVVNGGTTLAPFYRREVQLEYDTYYHAAFSIFVVQETARVGIKVGNSSSDQVYGMMFSQEFSSVDKGKWIDVELTFKVPADADVDCDMENVYLEFFNAHSAGNGNDYYIDNIFLEKLDIAGACPTPTEYIDLVCPADGGSGCTQEPATGTPDGYTKVGITVQQKQEAWPENIPNGFISLESKEKGFVITRVAHVGGTDGTPDLINDSVKDPKEGMIVYDIADNCVKLYNGSVWSCLNQECGGGFTLLCNSYTVINNSLIAGSWSGQTGILPYANGDGSTFVPLSDIPSEGVTGLTANISLPSGSTITEGSGGFFNVSISGIASGAGFATFPIEINGSSCSIVVELMP